MEKQNFKNYTAFKATDCVASGNLLKVVKKVKEIVIQDKDASILIFDDATSELIEVDFRGTQEDVLMRLEKKQAIVDSSSTLLNINQNIQRGPGRPKLGVVSREVTLLPRHWDWLNSQSGGASVALRKLVEDARKVNGLKDKMRHSQEVTYRFMYIMAGNFVGFEEATRALFAGDSKLFNSLVSSWPIDIHKYTLNLAKDAFKNIE